MLQRILGPPLVLLCSAAAQAQLLNRGAIEGTTTDPQGGLVPGVEVTITSVDTALSQIAKTNTSGYYRVVDLIPGKYRAHFEARGFAPVDVTEIELPAGEVIKIDASLKLGTTRELVRVTAEAPLLETSASNFSTSLETRTVQEMPMQGRDLQQLIYLMPGVNPVSGPPGSNFGFNSEFGTFPDPTHVLGSDLSVNGGQGGANAWYLDGNLNLSSLAENIAVDPSPDAVQEFQAITNAFAAEYSRTGGAVFNVVLKSGSNTVHGNIYEFLRNDATNARNPFTSIDALGNIIKDRQLRFNNFGGTLGGPVYLPHIYNGRNRTFFFFSWDVQRLNLLSNRAVFTVPTAKMQRGDFSEDPNVVSNGLWNPYSTIGPDQNGIFQRTAIGTPAASDPDGCLATHVEASGGSSCSFATQIPTNTLDPTAMFFMKSFPAPNYNDPLSDCPLDSTGLYKICDNFRGSVGSSQNHHNISLKIDHEWSTKSKYFGEWLYNPVHYRNYRVPWTGATFPQDGVGFGSRYPFDLGNQIIAFGNTYTINPTLINEFRVSFSRQFLTTHPSHPYPDSVTDQSQVQQILAPLNIPEDPFFPLPNWQITGAAGSNMPFGPPTWVNMNTGAEAYTILDNVTKVIGRHTLKTGFIYRLEHTAYESGFPTGFGFGGELTQDPNLANGVGGSGLAQFMMGAVATGGRGSSTGLMWKPYERFRYWGFFGQDDFRITPNFTLNLGLRYDLYGLYQTRQQPASNFCLGCPNSDTGLLGKVIYTGDPEWPSHGLDIAPANKTSIGPRINFAWTPFADKKTIIRGGYDIFYSNAFASINSPGQSASNAPGWNQEYDWNGSFYPNQCAPGTGQCIAFPLSNTTVDKRTLTTPAMPTTFPAQNRSPLIGIGLLQFFTPPSHDPMVQTWSFEIQRELPGNMMISIGYVGNHGTHLVGEPFRQFNYVHTKDLQKYQAAAFSNADISHFYSGKTAAELQAVYPELITTDPVNGQPQLPLTVLLKPYPFYGALSTLQNNTAFDGTSIYHGLNVRLQKRYARGLDFVVAYTISKNIDNALTGQTATMLVDPIHYGTRSGGIGGRAGELGWAGGFGGSFADPDNKKRDRAIAADDIPQILNIAANYELPFGAGKPLLNTKGVANQVLGGWRLTANLNAEAGLPQPVFCPGDELTNGDFGAFGSGRCNLIGDPHFKGHRSRADRINQWINPAAFEPPFGMDPNASSVTDPRDWQLPTMGPRLANFRSPGFWNVDTALTKEFRITESKYFQLRWEAFNALNHQNLGLPNSGWCLPPNPDGSTDAIHQAGCQFGRITNIQTDPRSMEFALKFFW
jgi:hypothetical protein